MESLADRSPGDGIGQTMPDASSGPLAAARQACEARLARLNAQKRRMLAAERAARLEARLQEAAEAGLRAEIARRLAARRRLLAVQKIVRETQASRRTEQDFIDKPAARATPPAVRAALARVGAAALGGLLLGVAATMLMPYAAGLAGAPAVAAQPSVLPAASGDGLTLSLSYSLRAPAAR